MNVSPNGTLRAVAAVVLLSALVLVASGCSTGSKSGGGMTTANSSKTMQASTSTSMGSGGAMADDDKPDPNAQTCSVCGGAKAAAPTTGTVEMSGGKQVVTVAIKDGSFSPNRFVAKAGTPTTVVFKVDGKPAKGCLSNPTFKSLNKSVNVTTGEKSIDLGSLTPGTYEFTCAMGMNMGQIVVE